MDITMKTWTFVAVLLCFLKPVFTTDGKNVTVGLANSSTSSPPEVPPQPWDLPAQNYLELSPGKSTTVVTDSREISALPFTQATDSQGPDVQTGEPQEPGAALKGSSPPGTDQPDRETVAMKKEVEPVLQSGGEEQLTDQCLGAISPATMQLLGKAITDFGMELFQKVLTETKQPNVVISPLSIVLGLAQLTLGSVNKTEEELVRGLHFEPLNCSHLTLHSAINSFKQRLSIASTIYIQEGFHIKSAFRNELEKFYNSRPQSLSGVSAIDTGKVNAWVELMTGGKIKTFLEEVPSATKLMLVNAINFKGLWQVQFDPLITASELFYLEDGSKERVAMMQHPKYPISIYHHQDLQSEVVRMAFKQNMSFIVVKPFSHGRLDSTVGRLNVTDILQHFSRTRPMLLRMPKLDVDFNTNLQEALRSLGLGSIFRSPDLSRISDDPLAVSSIQHKATMELREEGVQAAATTSVAMNRSLLKCNINQPFFFLIRDDVSGIPLFLGTIKDPQPKPRKERNEKLEVNLERTFQEPNPK